MKRLHTILGNANASAWWCALAAWTLACQTETAGPQSGPAQIKTVAQSPVCVGPQLPASAWQASPGPVATAVPATVPTLGALAPLFALTDFQPQSCGFKATYGIQAFSGKVTFIAVLAGW